MPVPQGSPGDRLLKTLGFHVRWTSWVLTLPEGATISERDLPPGYTIRVAEPDDVRPAHDVLEDAFLEWWVRERESFEDFEAATAGRPGFEPWNLRVALDPDGEVAGVSLVLVSDEGTTGYVDRLAVRADQRHRGLAQALLVDSFAAARHHGTSTSELSTDSRTGALGQRAGRHGRRPGVGQSRNHPDLRLRSGDVVTRVLRNPKELVWSRQLLSRLRVLLPRLSRAPYDRATSFG